MPKNSEGFNRELEGFLRAQGFDKIVTLDADGEATASPDDADQFRFHYTNGPYDYGTVTITTHGGKVTVFYNESVVRDPERGIDTNWTNFLRKLKDWSLRNGQMGFSVMNIDRLGTEMRKRSNQKREEKLVEGYYGGRHTSYNDGTPTIKMIIKHSKALDEGDQRYHHIEKIFLETSLGERILVPSKKPSVGRAFARHLAEGGQYNDDRWMHIKEIAEDISKLGGFVRATRGGQFNESVAMVVGKVAEHYGQLRETIKRLSGTRGYNHYFEGWQPTLMEGDSEADIGQMFVASTIDPRIERALPVLSRLKIVGGDIAEAQEFDNWANSIVEGRGPEVDKRIEDFAKLLNSSGPIPVGADAMSIKGQLEELITDEGHKEELFSELSDVARADPDNDAKPVVVAWLQKHRDDDYYGEVLKAAPEAGSKVVAPTPAPQADTAKAVSKAPAPSPAPKDKPATKAQSVEKLMPEPLEEEGVEGASVEEITNAILGRIEGTKPEIFTRYGSEVVYDTASDVADFYEGATELGSSDVSIMVQSVLRRLEEDHGNAGIDRIKSLSGLK